MSQKNVTAPAINAVSDTQNIVDEAAQVLNKKTRQVKLTYQSCCGCGCHDATILRTVPEDSELMDGDRIYSLEDTDEWV